MTRKPLIYLASPYTNSDRAILIANYEKISEVAAKLIEEGNMVYAPVSYGHNLCNFRVLPTNWEFWMDLCFNFLTRCDKMVICMIPGWEESKGIAAEIEICKEHNIPIEYLEYE